MSARSTSSTGGRPRFIHDGQLFEYEGSIFDKLTDPALFTGTHKLRFDARGRGRGVYGRDTHSVQVVDDRVGPGDDREGARWSRSLRAHVHHASTLRGARIPGDWRGRSCSGGGTSQRRARSATAGSSCSGSAHAHGECSDSDAEEPKDSRSRARQRPGLSRGAPQFAAFVLDEHGNVFKDERRTQLMMGMPGTALPAVLEEAEYDAVTPPSATAEASQRQRAAESGSGSIGNSGGGGGARWWAAATAEAPPAAAAQERHAMRVAARNSFRAAAAPHDQQRPAGLLRRAQPPPPWGLAMGQSDERNAPAAEYQRQWGSPISSPPSPSSSVLPLRRQPQQEGEEQRGAPREWRDVDGGDEARVAAAFPPTSRRAEQLAAQLRPFLHGSDDGVAAAERGACRTRATQALAPTPAEFRERVMNDHDTQRRRAAEAANLRRRAERRGPRFIEDDDDDEADYTATRTRRRQHHLVHDDQRAAPSLEETLELIDRFETFHGAAEQAGGRARPWGLPSNVSTLQ